MKKNDRPIPSDLEAERALLGALLLDRDAIIYIADMIDESAFFLGNHQVIYRAILDCYQRRTPPDIVNVAAAIKAMGSAIEYGYLTGLIDCVPSVTHAAHYAHIIDGLSVQRQLIAAAGKIASIGYETSDPAESINDAMRQLTAIIRKDDGDLMRGSDIFYNAFRAYTEPEKTSRPTLKTGINLLDRYIGRGFEAGEVVTLAGRTGTGKSTLAQHIRLHALLNGWQVLECSAEMKVQKLVDRMVSAYTQVPAWRIRTCWNAAEQSICQEAASTLGEICSNTWHLWDAAKPLETISRQAVKLQASNDMPLLIIIDHIGLMPWPHGARDETRAVAMLMPQIKRMAMERSAVVLVVSQMNRQIEGRGDDKPQLSDLYASDRIAQDSDRVLMAWINKVDQEKRRRAINEKQQQVVIDMQIHIEKNRDGNTGTAGVRWFMDCFRLDG